MSRTLRSLFLLSRQGGNKQNFVSNRWLLKSYRVFFWITFFFLVRSVSAQDSPVHDSVDDTTRYEYDYSEVSEIDLSEDKVHEDTFSVTPRNFDESKLDDLRNDKDFDYSEPPTVGENLWDRFWQWVSEFIGKLFRGAVTTNWGRILIYVGCLIVLVMIVLALLKVDGFKVLFKGADSPSTTGVFYENIHTMDFDALIKEATEKGDFRNAVRLIFLHSLKILSDGHHIHWQPGKTNHDYLEELKIADLRSGLGELSFYFDYAWYGGFSITSVQFDKVKNIFHTWRAGIR